MRYKCLVLDHDETVVQTEKTIGYPFFCEILQQFRPGATIGITEYVQDCHRLGFADLCRQRFQFTEAELKIEHEAWSKYILTKIPEIFDGIERIIQRHKAAGGLLCVVSHSTEDVINRDYLAHFGLLPDAVYGWDLPPQQRKPNTYPLEAIMERFHLSAQEILVVDDSKLGWEMAHPLKIDIAFSAWGKEDFPHLSAEMKNLCNYSFASTKDLEMFLFKEG